MDRLRDVVRAGRRLYLPVQDWAIGLFGKVARRGNYIKQRIEGDDPLRDASRAAIYVHFDRDGIVHDYVVHQLCELVGAGYRVTFVSNAPQLPVESRARVQPLCKELIWRFNTGYDFGAYKDGIASIAELKRIDSLVLMNDSVYGPFWNLRDVLAGVDRSAVDFWGIADSFENKYHIQTFFMMFMPNALRSTAFKRFWTSLLYIDHRMWVIRNAEVKLTQVLQEARLKTGVLAPYGAVAATARERLARHAPPGFERGAFERFRAQVMNDGVVNPTHFFWDVLITDYACPFIKRDLLTTNPNGVPGTSRWPQLIAARSGYDVGMIARHLKR
ncbi:rhamnan synthesis F family protein [Tardiphaga sp. OK245]|uniref:rhamnan synthesis F family protein n=1 Tax=Tardiphaga sp. OK245 TaxID=1855306 RepID=UPI0008A7309C|nr:rhamnan synthesis F family protein [Tardiphaga sp. OK245]SEI19054.1 Rhamnan synthesis protein F [Tardiphaga sp. OK245]